MKKLLSFVIVAMMVVSLVAPAFALTSAPAAHDPAENWLSIWIEDTEIDVSATTEVSVYVDVSNNVNGFEYLKFFIFYPECLTLTKTTGAGFVASSEVTTGLESKTANKGLRDAFDTLGLDPADYLDGHTKFTSPYLDVLRSDEADEDADCFDNGRIVCFKFTYDPELNPDGNDIEIRMFNSPDDQLHVSKPGYEYDDEFVNVEVYGGKIVVKNQGIGGGPSYENATLEVEDVTINKGDATAKFNINIYNNPGFYSCPILFIYDDDASFSDFTAGVASASAFPLSPKKADNAGLRDMDSASANAKYKWLTAALTAEGIDATGKLMTYFSVENNELVNITGDGVLFSVTLDTSALDAGTYDIGIVYSAANTIDEDYNDVKFDLVQGTLTVVGSECPHAHTENVNIVTPATCTTPATHDVKCTDCGEIIETGVVDTAALGHDYQETAEDTYLKEAATCTSPAVYFKSCSRCHEMSEETFTSGTSLGHDYQETAEDTYLKEAATCTEPAVYFKSCSRCHALSEETFTSGSALGHDFQDVVDEAYLKDAVSCTAPATYYKSCSRCHALSEETFTTGSALGHAYEQTAVTGNCGEAGTVTYTCSRCGDTYDDPVAEIPHNFTLENAVPEAIKTAASCDDPAVYYKTCSRCGAISTNDDDTFTYGDALGHDFQAIAEDPYIKTAATCTEPAVYFKSCSRCHTLSDETFTSGSALGHDFQETVEDAYLKAAATCTEPAVYFKSCSRCHALSEDTFTFGEALGHNHEAVVTDPTCTDQGYTTHT
ncbi:MAG: hypothetical protein IJQ80_07755, partial [Clostridia bacterium]|nr:hypothetical protein [Clostridia bacterium]